VKKVWQILLQLLSVDFIDGYGGYTKASLHVAFEVPNDKLDERITFLSAKGIKTSPKNKFSGWHGAPKSTSVYFTDPAGKIIELWAPDKSTSEQLGNRCAIVQSKQGPA
jgi:catechol-2,3-dioxygenase